MSKIRFVKTFFFPSLTAILLCLSFPPADIGYLAWVAFIPWFILIKTKKKYNYLYALYIGIVFLFIQLSWMRHVTIAAWLLLTLYCSAYFICFASCTRFIISRSRLPLTLVAPFVWVTLEYIRSFLLSGFPWFFAGHTQYQYLPVIQICDITGVYGISFVVVMVNAAFADLIAYRHVSLCWNRSVRVPMCLLPLVLLASTFFYGFHRLARYLPREGPWICLIQGNIPQDVKSSPTEGEQILILKKYSDLSFSIKGKPIDLLVWPETMVPGILNINPEFSERKIDLLSQFTATQMALELNTNLILGGIAVQFDGEEQNYYNSAYYYNRQGNLVARYDKVHLVPFGEFTPLKDYLPFLSKLVPYEIGLSHGLERTLFKLNTLNGESYTFGVSICYEDTVPPLIRKFKMDGADFMLNVTNDGWFCNSAELDQHLSLMVFRAVENRIGIARAANTGISSFVAPNGSIYATLTDSNGKYREISGTLINRIKLVNEGPSFYTRYGDWFPVLCAAVSGITLCFAIWRGKNYS